MTTAPTLPDDLYALIPSVYRLRDANQGYPLKALLAVIGQQVAALQTDIAQLYENWFIETCQDWVVPYIADLLGVTALAPVADPSSPGPQTQRSYVANVLGYRRRKGTAAMLEQLALDVTGWPAHAVEMFKLLATNQNLNHVRTAPLRSVDLRDTANLPLIGGPFEMAAHTVEIRRIASGRGRYAIPNVALYLWRLEGLPIRRAAAAVAADATGPGFFRFSPLGQDLPLFNWRRAITNVQRLATEKDVPGPLRRRAIYDDLTAFRATRAALGAGTPTASAYFGDNAAFTLNVGGVDLPVEALRICDLANWHRPPDMTPSGQPGVWPNDAVAIDPVLGRIAFAAGVAPTAPPLVTFYQGGFGPLGGGAYSRPAPLPASAPPVSGGGTALADRLGDPNLAYPAVTSVQIATRVAALRPSFPRTADGGVLTPVADRLAQLLETSPQACTLEITDSLTYQLSSITVPANSVLEIRAADGQRPLVTLSAPADVTLGQGAVLILNGLTLAASTLTVADAPQAGLLLEHCTLVPSLSLATDGAPATPAAPSVTFAGAADARFDLLAHRTIGGPLQIGNLPDGDSYLFVEESVIDDAGGGQTALVAAHASLARATILGATDVEVLDLASDSLFTDAVTVDRAQAGCARFSFIPDGSRVPQPYRCQPALALATWANTPPAQRPDRSVVLSRVVPTFTSTRYGDPGYAQLTPDTAVEIRGGASDRGEMGATNFVQARQRETNLRATLDEYLRFGLEAGLIYVT